MCGVSKVTLRSPNLLHSKHGTDLCSQFGSETDLRSQFGAETDLRSQFGVETDLRSQFGSVSSGLKLTFAGLV